MPSDATVIGFGVGILGLSILFIVCVIWQRRAEAKALHYLVPPNDNGAVSGVAYAGTADGVQLNSEDDLALTNIELAALSRMNQRQNQVLTPASNPRPISQHRSNPIRPRPIVPYLPQNDLPPAYEEVISSDPINSEIQILESRTSGIWVIEMDEQNPPPAYWISTHQPPSYPGVR